MQRIESVTPSSRTVYSGASQGVRYRLSVAFAIVAVGLAVTTALPVLGMASHLRKLLALSEDHLEAVAILARLRGALSEARSSLVWSAMMGKNASPGAPVRVRFDAIRGIANGLQRFADTSTERDGFDALRRQLARSGAEAERLELAPHAPDVGRRLPSIIDAMADTDRIAETLIAFNARQVQESARDLRQSLIHSSTASAIVAALGFGAALMLLRHARTAFTRYSTIVETHSEEMGAFAGRAAHELRNPLTTLGLSLTRLRADSTRTDALERANAALGRISRTIDGLLRFASAGGQPRPDAYCEVGIVLNNVVEDLTARLQHDATVIERHIKSPLYVRMEASYLQAVLANIIENAAKYGRTGEQAHVRIAGVQAEQGWAEITIADDGPGISSEALPHVFEPFFRASASAGGHGLGLATTKRLVDRHGGRITIESLVAHGTTVRLRLPRST
jgi:signal transduction histidine kinase